MKKKPLILAAALSITLTGCALDQQTDGGKNNSEATNDTNGSSQQTSQDSTSQSSKDEEKNNTNDKDKNANGQESTEDGGDSEKNQNSSSQSIPDDKVIQVDNPESLQVVVNKKRTLPEGYTPPDLTVPDVPFYFDEFKPKKQMRKEAAHALEQLFAAAKEQGIDLVAASGYRSYERQKNVYQSNVNAYGEKEANKVSAKPGTSEHQTGLAMDLTSAQMSFKLEESFRQTDEGEWLANHAHEYGFVIRYPKGKEDVTGYSYEPWHVRYVGKEAAKQIYNNKGTLEEFFGFRPYKK
ncbi:M15 family metallopeptidase [Halobacillus rhizosphaerae]|uniref:M15 family metallopeptidase n=1 Tax=Halobacillus rhizosphaerae TaxID=3064889 RepID=UPI00398B793B